MSLLDVAAKKLMSLSDMQSSDFCAVASLPHTVQTLEPSTYLLREGEQQTRLSIVLSGYACRHKLSADGGRQIVGVNVSGDMLGLESMYLSVADHNVQTLTRAEIAFVRCEDVRCLLDQRARIERAVSVSAMIESSILREWLLNVGRRRAPQRLSHFLCELTVRHSSYGLAESNRLELPLTQEQIGDTLGLTAVHVNRTLRVLEADGLISRNKRLIIVEDSGRLRSFSGFDDR